MAKFICRNERNEIFSYSFMQFNPIQWGSEIRMNHDFEWLKRGWFANSPDFKLDLENGLFLGTPVFTHYT